MSCSTFVCKGGSGLLSSSSLLSIYDSDSNVYDKTEAFFRGGRAKMERFRQRVTRDTATMYSMTQISHILNITACQPIL